jgi:predicted alpha/beta superfamily hydrolase
MTRSLLALLAALPGCLMPAIAAEADWQPVVLPQAEQRDVHSTSTGRTYRIFLSKPQHEAPAGGYPVLYVLDGNALFPSLALQAQALESRPDPASRASVLVVGVGYPGDDLYDLKARAEDYTPPADEHGNAAHARADGQGGADQFLQFLQTELKPLIEARYPVNPQRQTLFGHSYGGLFALYTLFHQPSAFQGYIAASPSIWWNHRQILNERDRYLADADKRPTQTRLLLTIGGAEQPEANEPLTSRQRHQAERRMVDNAQELIKSLEPLAKRGLTSELRIHPNADHGDNATLTAPDALKRATWQAPIDKR